MRHMSGATLHAFFDVVALIVFAIRRQGEGCSIGRSRKPDRALFDYSGRRNMS
jgi:hypothetical protein